jgi:hypothetical protein
MVGFAKLTRAAVLIFFAACPAVTYADCPDQRDKADLRSAADFPGGVAVDGLAVSLLSPLEVSLVKRLPIAVYLENVSAIPVAVDPNTQIYKYYFHVVNAQGVVSEVLRTQDFDNSRSFIYGASAASPGCAGPVYLHLADYVNVTATGVYTVTVTVDIRDQSDSKTPRLVTSNTASLIVSP